MVYNNSYCIKRVRHDSMGNYVSPIFIDSKEHSFKTFHICHRDASCKHVTIPSYSQSRFKVVTKISVLVENKTKHLLCVVRRI